MSTLQATNIKHASSATTNLALDTAGNATVGNALIMGSGSFLRNRIINGDMRIDQRNAGASVTPTSVGTNDYVTVDRWGDLISQASKFSLQQSSVAPPGFSKSLLVTSLSAYTITTNDRFVIRQQIEGFNTADFNFGGANAQNITLSFWVRSSLTGSFGAAIANSAVNRSYPFNYTIASADTWTYITKTIPGDTTGTWLTDNGVGLRVYFSLGCGSTYEGPADTWAAAQYLETSTSTSVVSTNGATFYLTGVQLETGSTATPFERRQYGHELALCQRYYISNPNGYFPNNVGMMQFFKVSMRVAPTVSWAGSGATISAINTDSFSGFSTSNQTAHGLHLRSYK